MMESMAMDRAEMEEFADMLIAVRELMEEKGRLISLLPNRSRNVLIIR